MPKELSVKEIVNKINEKAKINEAYFVGLCWSNPIEIYGEYADIINEEEFIHDVWRFYFDFGKRMYKSGINKFDTITVKKMVKELNISEEFNEFGEMSTIKKVIELVKDNEDNAEHYYESIKKNYTIRHLVMLFGDKVLIKKGKYDWEVMSRDILISYWNDKVNKISMDNVNNLEIEDLYIESEEFIRKIKEESAEMMPYYKSYLFNSISQGIPRGHVTMIGGFGGTGKTSLISEKFVMSAIVNREKTMIVLNEEDANAFRQKIVLSILFHEFHTGIDRKRLINGKLQESDEKLIRKAFVRMHELIDGETSLIKIIFMENYIIEDLANIVKYWANRGYTNLVIDTHKITDGSKDGARWEIFVEDTKTIYKWTREKAGGLNLRTLLTFQLTDSATRYRFLTFDAIGEGKKAKDEASIVYMFRVVWTDEYKGGKHALQCFKFQKNELIDEYEKVDFELNEEDGVFYLLFTPKNRFGNDNDTGQPILVIQPLFNFNHFKEIGWTYVPKDYN